MASLIDCRGAATASAVELQEEVYSLSDRPLSRLSRQP